MLQEGTRHLPRFLTHPYTLRTLNVLFLLGAVGAWLFTKWYRLNVCIPEGCGFFVISGWLNPLQVATPTLALTFAFLLLFPARVFGWWLTTFAWWYFPLSWWGVVAISPYTSSIWPRRTEMASGFAQLSFVFTVIAVGIILYVLWRKEKLPHAKYFFLLWAPAAAYVGYLITTWYLL